MKLETVESLVARKGQCTLLANVLLMTQKMLDLANDDEWDLVAGMEVDRRALLHECFETPVPPEHSEIFSEALAAMLHLNEELMSVLEEAKAHVAARQSDQIRTRKAITHYLDVGPLG